MLGEGLRPAAALKAAQVSMQADKRWLPTFLGRLHASRRVEVTRDAKAILCAAGLCNLCVSVVKGKCAITTTEPQRHQKLTSSLSANGNLSLCDFELALPSIVELHRRQF